MSESNQHSGLREALEIVTEAALGGAEVHVGPSDISTKDYEQKVWAALREVSGIVEQLEAMREALKLAAFYYNEPGLAKLHGVNPETIAARALADSSPAKNPLRKPGRSSECGHDGWQDGCLVCEREERDALRAMGEQSPANGQEGEDSASSRFIVIDSLTRNVMGEFETYQEAADLAYSGEELEIMEFS